MTKTFIDLHMHSYYSDDGQFSPTQLVEQCHSQGIGIMAITDHNCALANAEAEKTAQTAGITYIPGIEIDCTYQGINLHVLGYGIDYKSPDFAQIEKNIQDQGKAASKLMLHATQKLGFDVAEDDMIHLAGDSHWRESWTGEMFAEVLLTKPEYYNHPMLSPYRPAGKRSDNPYVNFYWDYYSQGKLCYTGINYPELEQVIDIIHSNHGHAVLAHPGMNLKNHAKLLSPILHAGMDGIEAFSSYHTSEQAHYFHNEAVHHSRFVTCGSDYHGKTKPAIPLGGHKSPLSDMALSNQLSPILP